MFELPVAASLTVAVSVPRRVGDALVTGPVVSVAGRVPATFRKVSMPPKAAALALCSIRLPS